MKSAVEAHPKRAEIERELIKGTPVRELSARYGMSTAALSRHRKKLPAKMAESVAAEQREVRRREGMEMLSEAEEVMAMSKKLLYACEEKLRDPDDPSRYTLDPNADDVDIIYVDASGENPVRRRAKLSEIIEGARKRGLHTEMLKDKSVPSPVLLNQTVRSLEGVWKILIDYAAELRAQRQENIAQHPAFQEMVAKIGQALRKYPEAAAEVERVLRDA